jgi:hypothetical protein
MTLFQATFTEGQAGDSETRRADALFGFSIGQRFEIEGAQI